MNNRIIRRLFYSIIVVIVFVLMFFIESSDSPMLETIGGLLIFPVLIFEGIIRTWGKSPREI